LRIAANHLYYNYSGQKKIIIQTKNGPAEASIIKSRRKSSVIRVSLGQPIYETGRIPFRSKFKYHINRPVTIDKKQFYMTVLSVGNPHAVLFVRNFDFNWKFLGSIIENHKSFPNRTNVEFVRIVNRSKIILNDWERGAGATGSSGTGAGAAVAAGVVNGLLNRTVEVVFPLGSLHVEYAKNTDELYLSGPVEFICYGEFTLR
jgi:diaminopimelate epimerase